MANTLNVGNGNWATKKDSLLGYNSENNNFKPLPFDFSRASNATVINKDGLIETVGSGQPRIDYKDDSEGALLLEPQRTNSLLQSNQFDTTWATSTGIGISSGYSGVYGSNDAWLLKRVDGSSRYLYQNVSLSNTQTFSIYLKADTTNWAWLFLGGTTSWAYFDLENGAVGATNSLLSSKIEPVSDGWFRCSITANVTLSSVRVYPAQSNLSVSGDSNLGIYIQYAQLEVGSYPTSYIPTQGSTVTRLADVCNNGGNEQVINSEQGCFYFEGNVFKGDDTVNVISITDGSINNYIYLNFQTNTNQEKVRYTVSGSTQINYNFPSSETMYANSKYAISYKTNEIKVYRNGVEIITDTNAVMLSPNTLNKIQFSFNNTDYFKGYIKDLKLYNTALTDNELAALTQV